MKYLSRLISILYRKNQIYLNTALEDVGLTASEQPFLIYLVNFDGASQEEMSTYLMIDKSATARAVESLIQKGFLRKEKDCQDKRVSRVFITEKGRHIEPQLKKILMDWVDFLMEDEDPNEVRNVINCLERIIKKVEKTDIKERWGKKNGSNKNERNKK